MMSTAGESGVGGFEPLLSIGMDVEVFTSNWLHCDRVSSYVARMVSHDRTDSLLYSNLLSSALNELLETAFRQRGPAGAFTCSVLRAGGVDRVELGIPCDDKAAAFFLDTAERLAREDAAEQYHAALFAEGPLDPRIGLFELAVDYGATIRVAPAGAGHIVLTAEFNLEGATHA